MRKIYFALFALPLTLLFSASELFNGQISNNIMYSILGSENADEIFLQGFCVGCVMPIMFTVLFGTYFYHDLMIGSVYIFTRQKSRLKWYLAHCRNLVIFSSIYSLIFIFTKVIISFGFSKSIFILDNALSVFSIFLAVIQICIIGAIIINALVILFGSSIGYLTGIGINLFSLLLGYFTRYTERIIMSANPFTSYIQAFYCDFSLIKLLVQLISIIVFMILGYIVVKKMDIGLSNKEI